MKIADLQEKIKHAENRLRGLGEFLALSNDGLISKWTIRVAYEYERNNKKVNGYANLPVDTLRECVQKARVATKKDLDAYNVMMARVEEALSAMCKEAEKQQENEALEAHIAKGGIGVVTNGI